MVLAEDLRGVNLGKEREERKEMGGFCEERREREVFLGERGNGNENGREEEEKSLLTVPVAANIFGDGWLVWRWRWFMIHSRGLSSLRWGFILFWRLPKDDMAFLLRNKGSLSDH